MKVLKSTLSFVPALVMMYIMFGFSAAGGEASGGMSQKVTGIIIETVDVMDVFDIIPTPDERQTEAITTILRKTGHVTEFFVLCLLLVFPLRYSFPEWGRKRILLTVIIICLLFACSDEWHQTFVPGREGKATDVLIDAIGIVLSAIFCRRFLL